MKTVKIAGAQGFYGDSPMAAIAIAAEAAADYLVHDALAELTLSILQKDKLEDPTLGYAKDIEVLAKFLIPIAHQQRIKIVTNSGGLNPQSAAKKVQAILQKQGINNFVIATITGDDLMEKISDLQQLPDPLLNIDTQEPLSNLDLNKITNANVYIGAKSVKEALDKGANLILAGRVADPCLTLGILAHEFNWNIDQNPQEIDLNRMANAIMVGHILECGGQACGGNSYAEWNDKQYSMSNLGYPIAHVSSDGSAIITKLNNSGGKLTRNTICEQLIYEIHDPANYITPDVIVDLTQIKVTQIAENQVSVSNSKGKPRPEKLKLALGIQEGFISEQMFFYSYPFAYDKCLRFIDAVKEIWQKLPLQIDKYEISIIGVNGIHQQAAPAPNPEILNQINELGIRIAIKHTNPNAGKMAIAAITCLGLNGPPGIVAMPVWGKINRVQLGLFPVLIDRKWVNETVTLY